MKKQCKVCNEVFPVTEVLAKNKIHHKSLDGRWWNHNTCPDCRSIYMKNWNELRGVSKRGRLRNRHVDSILLAPGVVLRDCPGCQAKTVNRFFCSECLHEKIGSANIYNDDLIYFGD